MTFAEAVQKMVEGKKMVNEKCPTIVYWFGMDEGKFLMRGENQRLNMSAVFNEDEIWANWMEKDPVETYVAGHDFVINNFERISDNDKKELFRILKKYKDTTTWPLNG